MIKAVLVDYGHGNIFSVKSALDYLGYKLDFDLDGSKIGSGDLLIIPGVAEFKTGIQSLIQRNQYQKIKEAKQSNKPIVGLCLGAQILLENSQESPNVKGFGFIKGKVIQLQNSSSQRLTYQGWSSTNLSHEKLRAKFKNPISFYFSHSYHMIPNQKSNVIGEANHLDTKINAVIKEENVLAIQFHPERSGYTGLDFLDWAINFENWL